MSGLYDDEAEHNIAACAAHSSVAASACTDRLTGEHFHDPRCWWIVQAGITIPNVCPEGTDPLDGWWREHAVALAAGVWPAQLQEWCQQSVHVWDIDGRIADRIIAAHDKRRRLADLIAAIEDLGLDVEVAA